MRRLTYPKANLFFLLAALTYAVTADCQQDGDQLQFQRQNLSSESSETSYLLKQAQNGDRIAQFNVASRYLQGAAGELLRESRFYRCCAGEPAPAFGTHPLAVKRSDPRIAWRLRSQYRIISSAVCADRILQ